MSRTTFRVCLSLLVVAAMACDDGAGPDDGPEGSYELEPALVIACDSDGGFSTTAEITSFEILSVTDDVLNIEIVVETDHGIMGPVDQANAYALAFDPEEGFFSGGGALTLAANDGGLNSVFLDADVVIEGQFDGDDSFDAHISGTGPIAVVANDAYVDADCSIDEDFSGTRD